MARHRLRSRARIDSNQCFAAAAAAASTLSTNANNITTPPPPPQTHPPTTAAAAAAADGGNGGGVTSSGPSAAASASTSPYGTGGADGGSSSTSDYDDAAAPAPARPSTSGRRDGPVVLATAGEDTIASVVTGARGRARAAVCVFSFVFLMDDDRAAKRSAKPPRPKKRRH